MDIILIKIMIPILIKVIVSVIIIITKIILSCLPLRRDLVQALSSPSLQQPLQSTQGHNYHQYQYQ